MLERAAGCFDYVASVYGQPLASASRSRRVLHHGFWVQSPHEPSLSLTWTLVLELSRISRQPAHREQLCIAPQLEFLHPPQTKASLYHSNGHRARRPLNNGGRRRQRCQSQLSPVAIRRSLPCRATKTPSAKSHRLNTRRSLSTVNGSSLDNITCQDNNVEDFQAEHFGREDEIPDGGEQGNQNNITEDWPFIEPAASTIDARDNQSSMPNEFGDVNADGAGPEIRAEREEVKLGELLKDEDSSDYELVWQKFCEHKNSPEFYSRMLAYLARSRDELNLSRAVEIYDAIKAEAKTSDDFRHGVIISLRLQNMREDEIFDEALAKGRAMSCIRLLLSRHILHRQWDKAADTWRKVSTTISPGVLRLSAWWEDLDNSKDFMPRLIALADYILANNKRTSGVQDSLLELAGNLASRVFRSRTALANATGEGVLSIIHAVYDMGLLKPTHLFSGLLTLNTLQLSRLRTQYAFLLYCKYRELFQSDRPPRPILGLMIDILADAENSSAEYLQVILNDFTRFYGHPDERAFQRTMTALARLGETDRVHELLDDFSVQYGQPRDLAILTPLLYVYAVRGDVKGTRQQFELLSQKHKIEPSLYCWNILLLACSRARDIEGAFRTFYEMQERQQHPNSVTFTTLMGLCAGVGDTNAVHYLVNLAREQGINGDAPMIDTLVESYCAEDNPQGALDLLEATNQIRLDTPMARGWNILLRYYAFKIDTGAVVSVQGRMRELSILPDEMTYAILMQSLALIGRTLDAAKILRSLHFNRQIDANLLNYAILINGFQHEGNRKMVEVIYQEVTDRFPRRTSGVKMAKLQSLIARDITNARLDQTNSANFNLPHAEEFLLELLDEMDRKDLATKTPQPGASFRRFGTILSYPAAYFRFITTAYSQYGRTSKFERLFGLYESLIAQETRNKSKLLTFPLELTAERLKMLMSQGKFTQVTECWTQAVVQAIKLGRPLDKDVVQGTSKSNAVSDPVTSPPLPYYPDSIDHVNHFSPRNNEDPLNELGLKILPAQRFLLTKPLHVYMRALAIQKHQRALIDLVDALERVGFALSSRNYNHYVQLLARASGDDHQLHAFKAFEARLADNLYDFSTVPVEARRYQRVAKFNMAYYVPEYRTIKFLGEVIRKFQARASVDGGAAWRRLTQAASKTMKFLAVTSRKIELTKKSRKISNRARAFQIMSRHKLSFAKSGTFIGRFRRGQYAQKPTNSALHSTPGDLMKMRAILGGSHPEVRATAQDVAVAKRAKLLSVLNKTRKANQIRETAQLQKKAIGPDLLLSEESDAYIQRYIRKSSLKRKPALKGLRLQDHKLLSYADLVSRIQGRKDERAVINRRTGDLPLRKTMLEKGVTVTTKPRIREMSEVKKAGRRLEDLSAVGQTKEANEIPIELLPIDRELKKAMDHFRHELSS